MAKHLLITGRVQGVGYRQWMVEEAVRLGVSGWVRNRRDGSVEAVLDGPWEAVQSLIERARIGPRAARVTSIEIAEAQGSFSGFDWRPSG